MLAKDETHPYMSKFASRAPIKAKIERYGMAPKLSVIVPVHNGAEYLEHCLDSLRGQSWSDVEILAIDDGSTDTSLAILKKYASMDRRIHIIRNSRASGNPGTPRNQAIMLANGRYIGFLDCDDWIEPEFFERLLDCAEGNDIVWASGYYDHRGDEWEWVIRKLPDNTDELNKYHPSEVIWDKIYATDFLKRNRILLGTAKASVDIPFVCKAIYYARSISCLEYGGYHYRRGVANSTISLRASSNCDFVIDTYRKLLAWAAAENVSRQYHDLMDLKMARNLCYTLEVIPERFFSNFYNEARSLFAETDEAAFASLCEKLGDVKLLGRYQLLLSAKPEDYAATYRKQEASC